MKEIERKWLMNNSLWDIIPKEKVLEVAQLYVTPSTRVRSIVQSFADHLTAHYYFTIKKGEGLERDEEEREIERCVFHEILFNNRIECSVFKLRYVEEADSSSCLFIDYYPIHDICICEVEFSNIDDANSYALSPKLEVFKVMELTNTPISAYKLANKSAAEIKELLIEIKRFSDFNITRYLPFTMD